MTSIRRQALVINRLCLLQAVTRGPPKLIRRQGKFSSSSSSRTLNIGITFSVAILAIGRLSQLDASYSQVLGCSETGQLAVLEMSFISDPILISTTGSSSVITAPL